MIVALAWIAGCSTTRGPQPTPVDRAWEAPAGEPGPSPRPEPAADRAASGGTRAHGQDTDPAARPEGAKKNPKEPQGESGPILAYVNGAPITQSRMINLLFECHGLAMLEQLVLLRAARQRAEDLGLIVGAEQIAQAHEDALRRLATPIGEASADRLDRDAAEKLLAEFLAAKNISRREWDLRMEQRAYLRAIAEAEVQARPISDKMLREQYARTYGEKVQVRHIQLSSLAAVTRARALLTEGRSFELVARQVSENALTAARGGLMPPFTRSDPSVPPLFREAAFTLEPGRVSSAVYEQGWYHLLKLERRFAARDVPFAQVDPDELKQQIKERLIARRQDELEQSLFDNAAVDIRQPKLRADFQAKHRDR